MRTSRTGRRRMRSLAAGCAVALSGAPHETATAQDARAAHPQTLAGKHVMGYQGWFQCPGQETGKAWRHWFRGNVPNADRATFDMWPDVAEMSADERCETNLTNPDGSKAALFSSTNGKTVDRHFAWMAQYGIDGAALQRFVLALSSPDLLAQRDTVLRLVREAAERHGRGFFVMYDTSGADAGTWARTIRQDWTTLRTQARVTESPAYMQHHGKPVVAIWGPGFRDRPGEPGETAELIAWLKSSFGGATVIGGVPSWWRTASHDSKTDPAWAGVYRAYDVISPWTVGRYADAKSWQSYLANFIRADLAEARAQGRDYLPVLFPGYSFANASGQKQPVNQIPRRCGRFYAMQAADLVALPILGLYTAMFDEVDEGTAMFKVKASPGEVPQDMPSVVLDADGCSLPSDGYLRLAGDATRALRGSAAAAEALRALADLPAKPY